MEDDVVVHFDRREKTVLTSPLSVRFQVPLEPIRTEEKAAPQVYPPFHVPSWTTQQQQESMQSAAWIVTTLHTEIQRQARLYKLPEKCEGAYACFVAPHRLWSSLPVSMQHALIFAHTFEDEWLVWMAKKQPLQMITLAFLEKMAVMLNILYELVLYTRSMLKNSAHRLRFSQFQFHWIYADPWTQGIEWRLALHTFWCQMAALSFLSRSQGCTHESTHEPGDLGCLRMRTTPVLFHLHALSLEVLKLLRVDPLKCYPNGVTVYDAQLGDKELPPGELEVGVLEALGAIFHARLFECAFLGHHYEEGGVIVRPCFATSPAIRARAREVEYECAHLYKGVADLLQTIGSRGPELWERMETVDLRLMCYNYERHAALVQLRYFWASFNVYDQDPQEWVRAHAALKQCKDMIEFIQTQYLRQCKQIKVPPRSPLVALSAKQLQSELMKDDAFLTPRSVWSRLRMVGRHVWQQWGWGKVGEAAYAASPPSDDEDEKEWKETLNDALTLSMQQAYDPTQTVSRASRGIRLLHDFWPITSSIDELHTFADVVDLQWQVFEKLPLPVSSNELRDDLLCPPTNGTDNSPTVCFWHELIETAQQALAYRKLTWVD